jgi:anti-sigma B factor antagonist
VTLSITTSKLASGAVEISPEGEIDVENAYTVKDAVADQLADNRPERIELNMQTAWSRPSSPLCPARNCESPSH